MTSFALVLPVLVMTTTIAAVPVHHHGGRHSRQFNTAPVVNPTPLHDLDANLWDGRRLSRGDVDRAMTYLRGRLHHHDFKVLPHLANKLSKRSAYDGVLRAVADALQRALHHHQERVNRYSAKDVTMLLHSLAKRRIEKRGVFAALGNRALETISGFNPQNVANTAWAFATLSVQNRDLFDALGNRALETISAFKPQEVANTAWAFATLSVHNRDLFAALGNRALETITGFNPQNVANTAWAFATLSFENRDLFDALGNRALETISGFNPQGVATTAWAFATLSFENRDLFDALGNRALETISGFNPQNVANTAWAFSAVRFIPDDRIVDVMVGRMCFFYSDVSFADEGLVQLHLWRLFIGENRFDSVVHRVCQVKTDVMVSSFRDAMSRTMQHPSRMEREVVDSLWRIYQPGYVVPGAICPDTGYSIDAALPHHRIAFEVNGPTHFVRDCCSNGVTSMNGASRLKRHLLQKYGWRIVDVNFEDWDKTDGDREQQQELLQRLLAPFS